MIVVNGRGGYYETRLRTFQVCDGMQSTGNGRLLARFLYLGKWVNSGVLP